MRKPGPPKAPRQSGQAVGIVELDRFSTATLNQWKALSEDLDELHSSLFFGVLPEQRRLRSELISALQQVPPKSVALKNWCRIVTYRYSDAPLSCAGSLQGVGGRFNAGSDLDPGTLSPWPALYLAANYETAFREKFQLSRDESVEGLNPFELALEPEASHSTIILQGQLHRAFDITSPANLGAVARVLRRIKMPPQARKLKLRLKSNVSMIQSVNQLFDAVCGHNWRTFPIQFGLPSPSHVLAELIRAAGFEAVLYRSSKGAGECLAVFPDMMDSASFIELVDPSPESVRHRRLDVDSADELLGWECVSSNLRPR